MSQNDTLVDLAQKISQLSSFMRKSKVVDDGVMWPLDLGQDLYLFVNHQLGFVMYANGAADILDMTVSKADLWIAEKAMSAFLEDITYRNDHGLIHDSVRDDKATSSFFNEVDFNRRFATVYFLKQALELGAKKLKLQKTKIVGKRMFFPIYKDGAYLVYGLNRQQNDFVVYLAKKPTISSCRKQDVILVDTENSVLKQLRLWVEEAVS